MVGRLTWYVNRLRSMSPAEVVHRVKERSLRKSGRKFTAQDFGLATDVTLTPLVIDDGVLADIAKTQAPLWRAELDKAMAGNWSFLGTRWTNAPMRGLWHLDPVSGTQWDSDAYCFDINYRHDDTRGDIKFVWEVNRLQILPMAAALARHDGDAQARGFVIDTLEAWIAENPVFKGVNWASGIELALRIVNIVAALSLLGPDTLDKGVLKRVMENLNAHLFWLHRYPSRYSSANNHLISELAASYILARLAPELPAAKGLAETSWDALMAQALCQIHTDGVGAEQSPTYTCFTLEWFLMAIAVARQSGDRVPDAVAERLVAAAKVLRWMMDDAANVPRIGDDDQGRVLLSGDAREADYVPQVLSSVCAVFSAPQFAPPRCEAHLRQLWTGTVSATGAAPQGAAFFDDGGYSVLRHDIAGRHSMIAMDHGPLGYLSIAAHGHADALALWWHLDGQPVFVDCGTYLYHSGGAERDAFRGTALHNTLILDGQDQSKVSGAFNWSRKAKAERIAMSQTNDGLCVQARHDGYKHLGVTHERKLMLNVPDGYIVRDQLIGTPKKSGAEVSLAWHLAPELTARATDDGRVEILRETDVIARIGTVIDDPESFTPSGAPVPLTLEMRPYSPEFGKKIETTAIICEPDLTTLQGKAVFTTLEIVGS